MNDRQTGRTTRQMQAAPQGAVFVWCNTHVSYPLSLAKALGRHDIVVHPLQWLDPRNVIGREFSGLVLDHAAPLLKILVIGAGVGVGSQIANLFPEPTPEAVKTVVDAVRIVAAENKRKLKAAKNLKRLASAN